jgi:dGTPase
MTIRAQTEEIEKSTFHPKAALSAESKGRQKQEKESAVRTCFQRDRDRIIHSKAFRRLKHKTQVFLAPRGDHYRTRLTHVLEVSQIARTIARALRLNEDLTEAVALGHDLGHTPFGHAGEDVLSRIHPGGFKHYEQSLRVVDCIAKQGRGLNLTHEVRDGIAKHSKGKGIIMPRTKAHRAATLEGQVVRVADVIAYLNHDLDDALRARVIRKVDIPQGVLSILGDRHSKRIDSMVKDVINTSLECDLDELRMSRDVSRAVEELRAFLYKNVYEGVTTKHEFRKAEKILEDLYRYYLQHPEEMFQDIPKDLRAENPNRLVCDFIAGMTDRFALITYERLFMPRQWGDTETVLNPNW